MDIRPLTRREQLEYQIEFLKQYKQQIEIELQQVEKEYKLIRKRDETNGKYKKARTSK